jgi:hypothetical protein
MLSVTLLRLQFNFTNNSPNYISPTIDFFYLSDTISENQRKEYNQMNTKWLVPLGALGVMVLFGFVLLFGVVGMYNTQATLKNTYEMKVKDNQSEFDNMWKKITQVVQIPEAKKEAFKEIFVSYAEARTTQASGKLMTWLQESVPTADLNAYDNAMNIIVASRDGWTMRQKELVDYARVYNQNLVTFPKNFILGMFGFQKIDPDIVTSTRTDEAFRTGQDEDVDLFKK